MKLTLVRNKKGEEGEQMLNNAIYIVLALVAFTILFYFVSNQKNSAAVWEEFYAKEISKALDLSKPGDKITLNVQKAVEIAISKNKINQNELFVFDNNLNRVCIKLATGRMACNYYFSDIEVIGSKIEFGADKAYLVIQLGDKR